MQDAIPARRDGPQRIALDAETDVLQPRPDLTAPAVLVESDRVEQGADPAADHPQALELGGGRQFVGCRDVVAGQELVGHRGGREVVVGRFPGAAR